MKTKALIIIIFCSFHLSTFCQYYDSFSGIIAHMNHIGIFQQAYPQEKVYLHFDNTGYFKGETMFFKAYVVCADNGCPTDISRVLYVEMLNPSGDIVERRTLRLENGQGHGDIQLDSITGTGFYEVRAYTRYMLNFGADAAFSRVFPIFKKPARKGDYSNPRIDQLAYRKRLPERDFTADTLAALSPEDQRRRRGGGYTVSVYPEGGWMVAGLPCRVALTVTDEEHRPAPLVGEVTDEGGNTLAVVSTDSLGRGLFWLVPSSRRMTLTLTTAKRRRLTFDMPEALSEGVSLIVDAVEEPDAVVVSFRTTDNMAGELLGYTVMNGGHVLVADTVSAESAFEIAFPRDSLRAGVNQLTLFNAGGRILAERLFFICPKAGDTGKVEIENRTETLSRCGKVSLTLHAEPDASLSFSAVDAGTMVNGTYGNIASCMLLSSDVRGYIPHPEYYIESDDRAHRLAADTLMLVNGWRRYDWRVMADVEPWRGHIQQVEDRLYVFGSLGRVTNKWRKSNPVAGVDLTAYLYNQNGDHLRGDAVTDSLGRYAFELPDIEGEWNMQIATKIDDKRKSYSVAIDRQFAPEGRYISGMETRMLPHMQPNLRIQADGTLEEDEDMREMRQVGDKQYALPTARIRKRKSYWLDYDGGWYNEHNGQLHADLYYDCDRASDAIADRGEVQPTLYEWLASQNNLIHLKQNEQFTYGPEDEETGEKTEAQSGVITQMLNKTDYGTTYDNRPTVWILNNKYCGITGGLYIHTLPSNIKVLKPNIQSPPMFLDEVKSVYIVSDFPSQADNYLMGIGGCNPAIIFVYTHPRYTTESQKGLRRTHFQGYNVPTKFEMEDYSVVPPVNDDFRRTLYWNPDVRTDRDGNATIEFWNNSTCRDMYISVEGMSPDGKFLNN